MNMPLFFLSMEQLYYFESRAWYYTFAGVKKATRDSAHLIHNEITAEIQKRRARDENYDYINFDNL